MPIVVQKYGGSSVADVPKLEAVARKVVATRQRGEDVVVVISAMGKTTDELVGLAHQIDANPPRRELDMLVTTGERVSMALLSMAIQKHGCDAISFTGSQSGIITNDRHFDARILEVRPWRLEDELARGRVVIVAGYQGMSYRREITTLGRGGSDTTAIALAAALGAVRAEIYSDVDGVYSADPRVVPDARHLPELSYDQMQEIAEAGAQILNSTAVEFARRARIAIHARSTHGTSGRETVVTEEGTADAPAVVGRTDLAAVELPASKLPSALRVFSEHGLSIQQSAVNFEHALLVVRRDGDWSATEEMLRREGFAVDPNLGAVTMVARELGSRPELMSTASSALSRTEISTRGIFTAPLRWTALIDAKEVDRAVRDVHAALGV